MSMSPRFSDLEAFKMVAVELSFRRAAERLSIDQSALSRRIQQLEALIGYQLVRRTTREVSLTAAGAVFYEQTRLISTKIEAAVQAGKIAAEGKRGILRVGYMSFAALDLMPRVVDEFTRRFPNVELDLRYIRTQGQKIELLRNNIDLGFMLGPFEHPQIETRLMLNESYVAILPSNHRLSTRLSVTLDEIARYPLVLGNMEQWETFRVMVDDLFKSYGHIIDVRYEASNALGILGLVGNGLGLSIYADCIMRFQPRRIITKPIANCDARISTVLAWNRAYKTSALRNFVDIAMALAK